MSPALPKSRICKKEGGVKIAVGADHAGFRLKQGLSKFLERHGYGVVDFGTHKPESCDYPPIGYKLAAGISQSSFARGILICKTGIGFSIVANKLPGVRAALCLNTQQARFSREHNNANVLVLAANFLSLKKACAIVRVWLKSEFAGGHHARRVRQIGNIERKIRLHKKHKS